LFGGIALCRGPGTLCRIIAVCGCAYGLSLRGSRSMCCGTCPLRCGTGSFALRGTAAIGKLAAGDCFMDDARLEAARQALFCEQVLAKSASNVLLETLREAKSVAAWEHFPPGDVFDPETGAQWYYHSHPPQEGQAEHGHFHCFVRPEGASGPIHHLVAVGVDAYGRLARLFTVNQWVVGDQWLEAEATIALMPRFDLHFARPSYLTNRWLSAVLALYRAEIEALVRKRDEVLATYGAGPGVQVREDKNLEVTSELLVDLRQTAASLGL
jgi:hypothetical protein